MDFGTSVKTNLTKKYATISGRASRSEYWYWVLFTFILSLITSVADIAIFGFEANQEFSPINFIFSLVILIPSICVYARRLHDVNRSGWWMLIVFTFIGLIPLFIWSIRKGDEGDNRFGHDPLSF